MEWFSLGLLIFKRANYGYIENQHWQWILPTVGWEDLYFLYVCWYIGTFTEFHQQGNGNLIIIIEYMASQESHKAINCNLSM